MEWRVFMMHEIREAFAFAASGGIALHLMGDITGDAFKNAPRVFKGRKFGHLFGPNREALTTAAVSLGCKPEWIQKVDDPKRMHFDLVGSRLERAKKLCTNLTS